jgi:hypothetical protein
MVLFAGMVTVAALSGCIFDTREAESPDDQEGSTWVVPLSPNNVFTNMRNGLEDLRGVNYKRSIQDVFTFIPLPEDFNNPTLAGAFDNWTADVEKEVVDRLLADATDIEVDFNNIQQIFDQTPFAYFNVDYELRVIDTSVDTTFYKGKAEFRMQDGSKGWQLIQWQDIERSTGFASWGFLRGTLRQL